MGKMIMQDGRMNVHAAAEYLGYSVGTLARKRSDGTGPKFVKTDRVWYFRADIDEWLLQKRQDKVKLNHS